MTVRDLLLAAGGAQQEVVGQVEFSSFAGLEQDWVVPVGVSSISAVVVGRGQAGAQNKGGRGGDLRYVNNLSVTAGETLQVYIYNGSGSPRLSRIRRAGVDLLVARAGESGTSSTIGGNIGGGDGGIGGNLGGGGAGGYAGNGGRGADFNAASATAGNGGGGGGGGARSNGIDAAGGGGGGVGRLGQGSNGAAGAGATPGGGGGSAGSNGGNGTTTPIAGGNGGSYGGGGGATTLTSGFGSAGAGTVRIIWPGDKRFFPSTRTGNE